MTEDELDDILVVARDAAHEAAAFVKTGFRKRPTIEHKGTADLVTSFDRESEALLRARLGPLGISIVGEEEGGSIPDEGPAFFIDPLFGSGSVSIALANQLIAVARAPWRG